MSAVRALAVSVAVIALILLAVTSPAARAAASSTCQAYNPQLCAVSTTTSAAPAASGSLPFTGLDLGYLGLGAAALIGTGVLVRRLMVSADR